MSLFRSKGSSNNVFLIRICGFCNGIFLVLKVDLESSKHIDDAFRIFVYVPYKAVLNDK